MLLNINSTLAFNSTTRLMVIAPHPDDETFGCAGLIQSAIAAGAALRIVFMTNGDNNLWMERAVEHRFKVPPHSHARWAEIRVNEASAALAVLAVPPEEITFLGFPDLGITDLLLKKDKNILDCLVSEISIFNPSLIVTSSFLDIHPDHSALAVLTNLALDSLRQTCATQLLHFLIHTRKRRALLPNSVFLPLTDAQQEIKRCAVLCHQSQLHYRRRKMLAKVMPYEQFLFPPSPGGQSTHPIRSVRYENSCLTLELSPRSSPGAFGRPSIYLLGWNDNHFTCLLLTLPHAPLLPQENHDLVEIRDLLTGSPLPPGSCRGTPRRRLVTIPLALVEPARRLFAKLNRPHGFFDEAGWLELTPPPTHS